MIESCPISLGFANTSSCCKDVSCGFADVKVGLLLSPNYPNNYQHYLECNHQLSTEPGKFITVEFESFNVSCVSLRKTKIFDKHQKIACHFLQVATNDYLRLYDGKSSDANLLAALTGYNIPANISSCGKQMHVVFTPDYSVTNSGYYAKIHTSEADGNCNTQTKTTTRISNAAFFHEAKGLESKTTLTSHKYFSWKHDVDEMRQGKKDSTSTEKVTCFDMIIFTWFTK